MNATPTALAAFSGGAGGAHPFAHMTLSSGGTTFYGTTNKGGDANNDGIVFSVPVGGGSLTPLAALNGTNGSNPFGGLTLSADGTTLYGTANEGGANGAGTVFSVPVGGGSVTTLYTFNPTDANGSYPESHLLLSGGVLYGTTVGNGSTTTNGTGPAGDGTVFALTPAPEPSSTVALGVGALLVCGLTQRARKRRA